MISLKFDLVGSFLIVMISMSLDLVLMKLALSSTFFSYLSSVCRVTRENRLKSKDFSTGSSAFEKSKQIFVVMFYLQLTKELNRLLKDTDVSNV